MGTVTINIFKLKNIGKKTFNSLVFCFELKSEFVTNVVESEGPYDFY